MKLSRILLLFCVLILGCSDSTSKFLRDKKQYEYIKKLPITYELLDVKLLYDYQLNSFVANNTYTSRVGFITGTISKIRMDTLSNVYVILDDSLNSGKLKYKNCIKLSAIFNSAKQNLENFRVGDKVKIRSFILPLSEQLESPNSCIGGIAIKLSKSTEEEYWKFVAPLYQEISSNLGE